MQPSKKRKKNKMSKKLAIEIIKTKFPKEEQIDEMLFFFDDVNKRKLCLNIFEGNFCTITLYGADVEKIDVYAQTEGMGVEFNCTSVFDVENLIKMLR